MSVAAMHTVGSCSAYSEAALQAENGPYGSCHDYRKRQNIAFTVAVTATQLGYQGEVVRGRALPAFDLRALDAGGPT